MLGWHHLGSVISLCTGRTGCVCSSRKLMMVSAERLLLCFITLLVLTTCTTQMACLEPEHGIIREGYTFNDPSALITATAFQCGCKCSADFRCKSWTRDSRTGACAFKEIVVEARLNPHFASGVVGGERLDPNIPVDDSCITLLGIDFKGSDYKEVRTETADECCRACENDRKCASWTRIRKNGRCFLKDGVPLRGINGRTDGGTAF